MFAHAFGLPLRLFVALLPGRAAFARAHDAESPSVHDTIAAIVERIGQELSPSELVAIDADRALELLTPTERAFLGSHTVQFHVDAPARLLVACPEPAPAELFWLADQKFLRTKETLTVQGRSYRLWEKTVPAGHVGLGVTSLVRNVPAYFVFVLPAVDGGRLPVVDQLEPARLRTAPATAGTSIHTEVNFLLPKLPSYLTGTTLVRTRWESRNESDLTRQFRATRQPAGLLPDQVVLTWADDPRTTQTVQWRTTDSITAGEVRYLPHDQWLQRRERLALRRVVSHSVLLETPDIPNDPRVRLHRATLTGLTPGTTYVYEITGGAGATTAPAAFTTAPAGPADFSFIYMGDVQNGFDQWSVLLAQSQRARPDAAFYLLAGDLIDRGQERDDWDEFFGVASPVFAHTPLVPVIGNHECQGADHRATFYRQYFGLPANGPDAIEPGRAYHFTYGETLFVILDSNLDPATQTGWLEATLARSNARWKIVSFHHPLYGSDPRRSSTTLRDAWLPILDRYVVDLVLQGHDHAYLRTYPMRGDRVQTNPATGTTYVVAVAGSKMYKQGNYDYAAQSFVEVPTWQVIDLHIAAGRLHFRAYDVEGVLRDEFVREKP